MTLEFAQILYFRELDRRTALDAAPPVRIAALAVIGGAFSVFSSRYTPSGPFLPWFFLGAAGGVIVCSVLAAIWIIRSYVGYRWRYLTSPITLLDHYRKLEQLPSSVFTGAATAREIFDAGLVEKLVMAAAHNATNNNARSELMYYASIFVALAFGFGVLAGIPMLCQLLVQFPFN